MPMSSHAQKIVKGKVCYTWIDVRMTYARTTQLRAGMLIEVLIDALNNVKKKDAKVMITSNSPFERTS